MGGREARGAGEERPCQHHGGKKYVEDGELTFRGAPPRTRR